MTRSEHPNGLILELPAGYKAGKQPDGFLVEPDPPVDSRSQLRIDVLYFPGTGASQPASSSSTRKREVAPGLPFEYTVSKDEAQGSGGPTYRLWACRKEGVGTLCLHQQKSSKHGEPDFELWSIAPGASRRP